MELTAGHAAVWTPDQRRAADPEANGSLVVREIPDDLRIGGRPGGATGAGRALERDQVPPEDGCVDVGCAADARGSGSRCWTRASASRRTSSLRPSLSRQADSRATPPGGLGLGLPSHVIGVELTVGLSTRAARASGLATFEIQRLGTVAQEA
jgi:hypothetical protein